MTYLFAGDSLIFIQLLDRLNVGKLSFENKDFEILNVVRLRFKDTELVLV